MSCFLFQTLQEEYIVRLEKARTEILRKVEILESKKRQQQSQLIKLRGEKKQLTSKAASLSETYQDLQDNNDRLSSRLEAVLAKVRYDDRMTKKSENWVSNVHKMCPNNLWVYDPLIVSYCHSKKINASVERYFLWHRFKISSLWDLTLSSKCNGP